MWQYLYARLTEPSTYAGIAGLLAVFHVSIGQDTLSALGAAAAALLAMLVPDVKKPS